MTPDKAADSAIRLFRGQAKMCESSRGAKVPRTQSPTALFPTAETSDVPCNDVSSNDLTTGTHPPKYVNFTQHLLKLRYRIYRELERGEKLWIMRSGGSERKSEGGLSPQRTNCHGGQRIFLVNRI